MRTIFLSYRRDDAEGQAGRLYDALAAHFGEAAVFMDVSDIAPGRDFRWVIDEHVNTCGVLLALIGKHWLDARDTHGKRRIDDAADFVRLETVAALQRGIPVVPVLVHGARMPKAEELPQELQPLAYRNGVELTHARWDSDVSVLIAALTPYVDSAPATPSAVASRTAQTTVTRGALAASAAVLAAVTLSGGYAWHKLETERAAAQARQETRQLAARKIVEVKRESQGTGEARTRQAADQQTYSENTRRTQQALAYACAPGFVWREARPQDRVCVPPASRAQAAADNQHAAARRESQGGAYGAATCNGYVWREAFAGDTVCVTPAVRAHTAEENAHAATRLASVTAAGARK